MALYHGRHNPSANPQRGEQPLPWEA
uniref:Uncharacterized protein n=1 Tax=Anguilla anguilla TaxID=7936 RepID=A0A0E9SN82_ANGAN